MKLDVKSLIEQVVKEEMAKFPKAVLKENSFDDEQKAEEIEETYGTAEIQDILNKWDYLGFDSPGLAMNAILLAKNWDTDWDVIDEDPADIAKVKAWKADIYKKYKGDKALKEAKAFKVNPKYNVFAVDKATNKIVEAWDLDPKNTENIKDYLRKTSDYLKMDLKDRDITPSSVFMGTVKSLKDKGIDPFNWDSWKKYTETPVNETTIITTSDGTLSTASPDQKKQAQTASATGDSVKVTKTGTPLAEKKAEEKKEDKEDAPVEDKPVEDATEESTFSLSSTLNKYIASAIDTAAKCIQDSGDKKYEKVLGKVIKNLTAAQDSLEAVQAHETKLSEQAAVEDEKATSKHTQALRKALKGSFKHPEHIEAVIKKYQKVIKASKDKDPNKVAEAITLHALKEGYDKK